MTSASVAVSLLAAVCFQRVLADCQQHQNDFHSDAPTMLLQSQLVLSNQSKAQAELLQVQKMRPFSDKDLHELLKEEQGEKVRPPKGDPAPLDKTLFAKQGPPSLKDLQPLTPSSAQSWGVKKGIPIAKSIPSHKASSHASGRNDTGVTGNETGSNEDAKSENASGTDGPSDSQ